MTTTTKIGFLKHTSSPRRRMLFGVKFLVVTSVHLRPHRSRYPVGVDPCPRGSPLSKASPGFQEKWCGGHFFSSDLRLRKRGRLCRRQVVGASQHRCCLQLFGFRLLGPPPQTPEILDLGVRLEPRWGGSGCNFRLLKGGVGGEQTSPPTLVWPLTQPHAN